MRGGAQSLGIASVVLAALTTGLTFAHTLELPQKLNYDAAIWIRIQQSLYRYFALIGGPIEAAAVIAGVVFAFSARGLPGRRLAIVGAGCVFAALALWFVVVNTANAEIGSWTVDAVPADWQRWRTQWELGHAVRFAVTLAGFVALLLATMRISAVDIDADRNRGEAAGH